jgi:hypothetical protein
MTFKVIKCDNNYCYVNPVIKVLHNNKQLSNDNFNNLIKSFSGFSTNVDKELNIYENINSNLNFSSSSNDEKNLVKLLANINTKVKLSKEVL